MRVSTRSRPHLAVAILVLAVTACGGSDEATDVDLAGESSDAAAGDPADEVDVGEVDAGDGDAVDPDAADAAAADGDAGDEGGGDDGALDISVCLPAEVVAEASGLELADGGISADGGYCTYANVDVIADQHRVDYRIDRFLDDPPGRGPSVPGLGTWAEVEEPGLLVIGLEQGGALAIDARAGREPLDDDGLIALAELLLDGG